MNNIGTFKTFAFIPAKTNSQGLPCKLFKTIGNRSLLEWTMFAALRSVYIDVIYVSSNDLLVKEAIDSIKNKVSKPVMFVRRPDELCTPTSKTEDAISHLFDNYDIANKFDAMVMLQATSPARRDSLIDKCMRSMAGGDYDSLITVKKTTPFFWEKCERFGRPLYDLKDRPMRQELGEEDFYYHDNGNIYITKTSSFLKNRTRVSGKTYLYETPDFESTQIDTPDDLAIMTKMYEHYGSFL